MDCIDYLKRKFEGRGIDEDTMLRIFEEAKKERASLVRKMGNVGDLEARLLERIQQKTSRAELLARAHKRAAYLQLETRLSAFNFVRENFAGREEEGLSALLVGTNRAVEGARMSIDAEQTSLKGWYLGGLITDIQSLSKEHFDIFRRGVMDEDIARALFSLDNEKAQPFTGPKEAMDIAGAIRKWQEKARLDQNAAGAWTGKLEGYIVRQSHDREKIYRAGYKEWRDAIEPLLDWERMDDARKGEELFLPGEEPPSLMDADERENFLRGVYSNLAIGRKRDGEGKNPLSGNGFSSSIIGSSASKASEERVLHFKGPDEWMAYNRMFGTRSLREAVMSGLSNAAENTVLMKRLGPSPQANFKELFNMVYNMRLRAGDAEGVHELSRWENRLKNRLAEVDGTLRDHSYPRIAAVGRWVRAFQNVTKLGGAVLSSFTDIPVASSEIAYQGGSFLGSLGRQIADLATLKGRGSMEEKRVLAELGVFFDTMNGDILARISGDESAGFMTRLQGRFFQLNGLSWWTDSFRRSVGLMMAHGMAVERGLAWNSLSRERSRVLSMYGILEPEWELIRKGKLTAADGREYLTPEVADTLSSADIAAYMAKKGMAWSEAMEKSVREDIAGKMRTFYRDRINFAVLDPDAKTRAALHQGTKTGTITGEVLRCITQFKSFPTAFLQKVWGREIYGKDGFRETASGMAWLILATTLFGYGSMVAKDLAKGRNPRDPSARETWLAALMQGGGLGIYGDFIFGNHTRYGGSLASNFAGPTFGGTLSDISAIWEQVREGDAKAQAMLRFAINNTPGNNLWYARSAFDYLIGYQLFEWINPGYFRRMKKRVEKENKQTFFASPVNW